jgi:ATP-dependent Lon protease
MRKALKSYLKMGKFTIANYHEQSNASFILLGNIRLDRDMTPIDKFYFTELPKHFMNQHYLIGYIVLSKHGDYPEFVRI